MTALALSYAGDGHHTGSYYSASANPAPVRAELSGDQQIYLLLKPQGSSGEDEAL